MGDVVANLLAPLLTALKEFAAWIWQGIQDFLLLGVDAVLDGVASMFEALPAIPQAVALSSAFGGIPAGVGWFLEPFAIGEGLAIIAGAYALRFFIRRLPFVG